MATKKAEPQTVVEPTNDPAQNTDAITDPKEPTLNDIFQPEPNISTNQPDPAPAEPATAPDPNAEPVTKNVTPDPVEPTEPEPAPQTSAKTVVEPEPAPVDFTQNPEYQRMVAENVELKQLKDVVLSDPTLTQSVVDKLSAPQQQPQAQVQQPTEIPMPKVPEYAALEDLKDPTSETSRWFAERDRVLAENVRNTTQTNIDQQMNQKFQQYEQQKAEADRQQSLQNAITTTQQKVGADAAEWQKFMTWANQPGKDMDAMLGVMYQVYQGANGNSQPQQPEPVVQPTNQPITTIPKVPLPNYSNIPGPNTQVVKTENEQFNEGFFGAYSKRRKF